MGGSGQLGLSALLSALQRKLQKKKTAKEIPLSHTISFDSYSLSLHAILMILPGICQILNNENNRPPTKAVGEVSGDDKALPSDHETTRKSQDTAAVRE